jgi:hypothetical protein
MDREDDHGEEVKGEEEIGEEEGRYNAEKEKDGKVGQEGHQEDSKEGNKEGGCQAQGAGEKAGPGYACGGTGSRAILAATGNWFGFRQRQLAEQPLNPERLLASAAVAPVRFFAGRPRRVWALTPRR